MGTSAGRALLGLILLTPGVAVACSDDGDPPPAPTPTTATTTTTVDPATAEAAGAYQAGLRERVSDALGFATTVQTIHADLVAGRVTPTDARARGAEHVVQVTRTVEAVATLEAPPELEPAPALARVAARGYLQAARLVAEAPDARANEAVASALRTKLLADSVFDRARLILQTLAGALSDRDRTLLTGPGTPDFVAAGVAPSHVAEPVARPRTYEQAVVAARQAAPSFAALVAGGAGEAERPLRAVAAALEADTGPGGTDEQLLTALQLAALVGAEAVVARSLGVTGIADELASIAREIWDAAGPRIDVDPLS